MVDAFVLDSEIDLLPTKKEIQRLSGYSYRKQKSRLLELAASKLSNKSFAGLGAAEKLELMIKLSKLIERKIANYTFKYFLLLLLGLILLPVYFIGIVPICFAILCLNHPSTRLKGIPEWELQKFYKEQLKRLVSEAASEANEMKQAELLRITEQLSEIKKQILLNKADSNELFKKYSELIDNEIAFKSPGYEYLQEQNHQARLRSDLSINAGGSGLPGYTPIEDPRWEEFFALLIREREFVQEMASRIKLPFAGINFYQDISRSYFGLQREGGSSSIYDEQVITNEVLALKESLVVQGDYMDNRVQVDRSVSQTTNIANATIDSPDYTLERIKKEIIKAALLSPDEAVSRVELMSKLPIKEIDLLSALEQLQVSGQLQISNRESGEIAYKLDRLA